MSKHFYKKYQYSLLFWEGFNLIQNKTHSLIVERKTAIGKNALHMILSGSHDQLLGKKAFLKTNSLDRSRDLSTIEKWF